MIQRKLSVAWLASILLLSVFAGMNWVQIQLTPDAGGQRIEVTGFTAFPIISALLLLQAASLLTSFFTPRAVGRWIAGLLAPVMFGHAVLIAIGLDAGIQDSVASSISEITGVAGSASQSQLVVSSSSTYLWVGYFLAIGLNVAFLSSRAILKKADTKKSTEDQAPEGFEDLWESQK